VEDDDIFFLPSRGRAGKEALQRGALCFITIGIHLWCNQITEVGATALAAALEKSASLQRIDLRSNQITDVGAVAMAAVAALPPTARGRAAAYAYNDHVTV